jgi:muconolactone delta-isomerase
MCLSPIVILLATYGTIYGMIKTTVYIPDDLKRELKRVADEQGRSEADIIREGIRLAVERRTPPLPTFGIFDCGDPNLLDRIDELMEGFGKR